MAIAQRIRLSDEELDVLLKRAWTMRLATHGPRGHINLVPLWFAWVNGKIYAYSRGQKIANLRRDPRATVLVDENENYERLIGAMMIGTAEVVEDRAQEDADEDLSLVRREIANKYEFKTDSHGKPRLGSASARGRTWRWIRFVPSRVVSWDNSKLDLD